MTTIQRTLRSSTLTTLFVQDYCVGSRAGTIYRQNNRNSSVLRTPSYRYQSTTSATSFSFSSSSSSSKNLSHTKRSFHPLTPDLAKAATQCVAETFATQEDPFTWLFNLKRHHWYSLSSMFIDRIVTVNPQLSVVCVNNETGNVDGVMINEDWTLPRPVAYRTQLSSDWWPVRAVFAELHQKFVDSHPTNIEKGEMIRCMYFTCVHPSARGQGVMKGLWKNTIDAARENGYKYITAQASSEAVRQVLQEHLGFQEIANVNYKEFDYEGNKIFAELPHYNKDQYSRISIHRRKVPSNLYV